MYQTTTFENYAPTLGQLADSGYPLFDDTWGTYIPEYKATLEAKIIQYYRFYQIGAETPDRFRHFLNAELAKKMPYYNQLYRSELIKFDPMLNYAVTTQGRKIENLVKLANRDTSRMGKTMRNFANSGMTTSDFVGNLTGVYDKTIDRDIVEDYWKNGDEDTQGTLDQTVDTDKAKDRTLESTNTIDSTLNKEGNETNANTKEQTENTTGSENITVTENKDTTRTETNLYSDTPQENLGNDQISVRWDYLTNARYINTSENMTDETENARTYTEEKTTNITENLKKDWTEEDTAHTDDKLTETENTTEDNSEKTDQETTGHKEWREQGNTTTTDDTKELAHTTEDTTNNTKGTSFENGQEDKSDTAAESEKQDEKQTRDAGNNEYVRGFMNVTPSDMLKAFRDTFINVDEMIIDGLRGLFMEVF